MTLRTRRIFFWSLIPAFIVAGSAAVLYSQGYRVDPETRAVTKVGALFVRGFPRSATVTLDGKALSTRSWWPLQSGTLVGSLAPGTYALHAEAPGYEPWDAEVTVRPALVTERKSLVLIPSDPAAVPLPASSSAPAALHADETLDALVLSDADGATYAGETRIPGTYLGVSRGTVVTTATQGTGKAATKLLRFQAPGDRTAVTAPFSGTPLGVMDDSVLVRDALGMISAYAIPSGQKSIFTSSTRSIGAVLRTSSYDAWSESTATSSLVTIRRRGSATRVPVPVVRAESLEPSGSLLGIRDHAGSLWLVNPADGSMREVGHRATWSSWNPDGSAVAAVIDGVLEVIPLREDAPHGKLPGTLRKGDEIQDVAWYPDGTHLILQLKDRLLFVDVLEGGIAEQHAYRIDLPDSWAFSAQDKTLYLLGDGVVQAYAFPD